jgi:hypothetical protein
VPIPRGHYKRERHGTRQFYTDTLGLELSIGTHYYHWRWSKMYVLQRLALQVQTSYGLGRVIAGR